MNKTIQTDIIDLNEKINIESAIIDMLILELNKVIVDLESYCHIRIFLKVFVALIQFLLGVDCNIF